MKNILVNALIKVEDFIEQESNLNRRNFNMTNKQEIYAGFEAHQNSLLTILKKYFILSF